MIAHIIPYQRTPRGTDFFDYAVPDALTVKRGDMVMIPLRSKLVPGLVLRTSEGDIARLKSVESLTARQYWASEHRMALLEWFAEWYGVSLPTAWKAAQFPLLKRPKAANLAAVHNSPAKSELPIGESAVLLTNNRHTTIEAYGQLAKGKKTLIVVAEHRDSTGIATELCHENILSFDDNLSPSQWYHLMEKLRDSDESVVVIGTKKMIFLDVDWSLVIIDKEDAKSHKQYDSNPRYHVRSVAERLTMPIVYSSYAPSMSVVRRELPVLDERTQWHQDRISIVDMNAEFEKKNYTWFSDALTESVAAAKKSFLFLNRAGHFRIAICKDCDSLLPPQAAECDSCRGHNIRQQGKGIAALESELKEHFPNKTILRIDSSVDDALLGEDVIAQADIIIGTEKAFRHIALTQMDVIGVLSVDHLLLYPHFQANERVWQLLSEICCAGTRVIVQTHAPENPVITAAVHNTVEKFTQTELSARKMLNLPPYGQHIRLINPKTETVQAVREQTDFATLAPEILVDRSE